MEILTESFNNFKRKIAGTMFNIGTVKRLLLDGPDDPKIHLINTHPNLDFENEVSGLLIDNEDSIKYPKILNTIKDSLVKEINENVASPFTQENLPQHLEELLAILSLQNSEINEKQNQIKNGSSNIEVNVLAKYSDEVSRIYTLQKRTIADIFNAIKEAYNKVAQSNERDISKVGINKTGETESKNDIRAFVWSKENVFFSSIALLHGFCIRDELISSTVDLLQFTKAFSGEVITEPLKIPWIVKGRNGQVSKRSLLYFIKSLEENMLISNPYGDESGNVDLFRIVEFIFVDSDGKSLQNLAESMSSIHQSNPNKKEKIDQIIGQVLQIES